MAVDEADRRADAARDASINRSLSTLRAMYSRYSKSFPKKLSKADIPYMPRIQNADNVGQGFVEFSQYQQIYDAMPENLQPLVQFLYFTGMRFGAAMRITWNMLNKERTEITIPQGLMKNKDPWSIPLAGPLEGISKTLREGLHHVDMPVFDATNFRREWNQACTKLGLGVYDKQSGRYHGLHPHDFRRSAARNLVRGGVDKLTAMSITGHRSPKMFDGYNIQSTRDKQDALTALQRYQKAEQERLDAETQKALSQAEALDPTDILGFNSANRRSVLNHKNYRQRVLRKAGK